MVNRRPQYGSAHRRARASWKQIVDAGMAQCCLCGRPLEPAQPWDLDHLPGTTEYRGVAHARCNRSEGATRGNRTRRSKRKVIRRWIL